jgi:hypothetical protein
LRSRCGGPRDWANVLIPLAGASWIPGAGNACGAGAAARAIGRTYSSRWPGMWKRMPRLRAGSKAVALVLTPPAGKVAEIRPPSSPEGIETVVISCAPFASSGGLTASIPRRDGNSILPNASAAARIPPPSPMGGGPDTAGGATPRIHRRYP